MAKGNKGNGRERADADAGDAPEVEKDPDFASEVIGDNAPEGFRRVNPLESAVRLYFAASEGATVQGILLGRFKRADSEDDDEKFYYQIRVTQPCTSCKDGDSKPATAQVGMVVHLDERAGIRDLEGIAANRTTQEVFVRTVEKIKLRGRAGSFWRCDVYAKDAGKATLAKLAEAVRAQNELRDEFGGP